MTQDEIAALIPANVVEAALKAYSGNSCECSSCRKAVIRTLAAGLAAWGGMQHMAGERGSATQDGEHEHLVLPIQEPTP